MAAFAPNDVMEQVVLTGVPLPITLRPPVPMSDDELLLFSTRNQPYRIERNQHGEIEIMTPVGGKGGRGESYLIRELDLWAERHGGASFSSNSGFHLPDGSMRSADAAWLSDERWNALSDAEQNAYPPVCPDFVIELASPSDSRAQLASKMQLWIANGAQLAWMIDPADASVTIFRPDAPAEHLTRPETIEATTVVPGFRLDPTRLWAK